MNREERWAKREAQAAAAEAYYAEQAEKHRQEHIAIVAKAIVAARWNDGLHWCDNASDLAQVAVDALLADGVVFARMGPCDPELNDGSDD